MCAPHKFDDALQSSGSTDIWSLEPERSSCRLLLAAQQLVELVTPFFYFTTSDFTVYVIDVGGRKFSAQNARVNEANCMQTPCENDVVFDGLNFQDLMVRQGTIDSPPKTPFILGFECAGDVEQVGENVKNLKIGDRVAALSEYKAWAELVLVPAKYVFAIPSDMKYEDAAAIIMNYIVAYILLFELGNLTAGKSVLFHSAGGGVGHALVQLSQTVPDVKIFGVASKSKHEALQDKGITHLLERGSDYVSEVRKIAPEGIDIVLDCLCGEECNRGYSLLKPMGKYVLYGSANVVTGETKSIFSAAKSWWQVDKVSPSKLFDENKSIAGFNLRHLLFQQNQVEYVSGILDKVFDLWTKKKITPVIDSKWALEDVSEAMQKMHDRKNIGKLILDPSAEPKPKPATPLKSKGKSIDKEDKEKDKKKEEESGSNSAGATNGSHSPQGGTQAS
ncbi:hypothetical protein V9T40_005011 [Parthenolecanium corni]|uniref:Enoyl reductase (ER) domain-containing protein n=1 Tax=Parthenolecanium corni TaxID=536013 RepID=A0AAN9THD4_9HEMI